MPARILIAVTHLLGSGHLVRARHLARALAGARHEVTLASGGMPLRPAGAETFAFVQLPPVKVEGVDFRNLLDEAGHPIAAQRRAARQERLIDLATTLRPDIVLTEHFPFGRRQLAQEFLGLIDAARAANPRLIVLSSIRDVLVAPRTDRIAEVEARLKAHFDAVLVHGDPDFLPLEASWPVSPELKARLRYTGYLASPDLSRSTNPIAKGTRNPLPEGEGGVRGRPFDTVSVTSPQLPLGFGLAGPGADTSPLPLSLQERGSPRPIPLGRVGKDAAEILVSGGGSAAALPLFALCVGAAKLLGPVRPWRILVGRGTSEVAFAALAAAAPPHVTIEWARSDFRALLANCALSISQAGYNTVLDLVAAGAPAIVVPFDEGAETEQAIRAEAMARAGLACCLRLGGADPLTPEALAQAVTRMLEAGPPSPVALAQDGAARTVAIVAELLVQR